MTDVSRSPIATLDLPVLRARVTLRLLEDAELPAYKGATLRGGFGHAFQRASCPEPCWGRSGRCAVGAICPYRWMFETPHPPGVPHLHDLQDVPRPFVIEPPGDQRMAYRAGEALEFVLVLIGRGIEHLPYFLFGFERLGQLGLGRRNARARLERVEALEPWRPTGATLYVDGRVLEAGGELPTYGGEQVTAQAEALPDALHMSIRTPLRVKARGDYLRELDVPALVQAACWRLNALSIFHGAGPWEVDHRALVEQARAVQVREARVRWDDWERPAAPGGGRPRGTKMGGIVGGAVLAGVPVAVREILLYGSLVHVGKACVFGHGAFELSPR